MMRFFGIFNFAVRMRPDCAVRMALFAVVAFAIHLIALPSPASAQVLDPVLRIADQPDSPIKITAFTARIQLGEGRYYSLSESGVVMNTGYRNTSGRKIVAVQLAFFAFDVWNDSIGGSYAYSYPMPGDYPMPPEVTVSNAVESLASGASTDRTINLAHSNPTLFLTGLVGVSKVRFEDGEVWRASPQDWLSQIEDLIPGISKTRETRS